MPRIGPELMVHQLSTDRLHRFIKQKKRSFASGWQKAIAEEVDKLVDATSGHELLTFMDAFFNYNQIWMAPKDEEKTTSVADQGFFCSRIMPFGLKNAGATYQRLGNKIFKEQIGRIMEVYVDDILVKSWASDNHITNLRETSATLRKYRIKLNPAKCAFGVIWEKFLGFLVSWRGIEVNAEKIKAI